jgi:hypothetical protein
MPRLLAVRNASRPLISSLVLSSLALLAGCSSTSDVTTTHSTPDIVAVTAADSVGPGQQLEIKIHWRSSLTCQSFEGVGFQAVDDSTFFATALMKEVHDPKTPCAARDTILEGGFLVADPPAHRFRIVVYGAHQQDTVLVVGGSTPAAIERHVLEIDDAVTNGPVQGGSGDYTDLGTQALIASLVTDSFGRADTAFACVGAARAYKLSVVGASGRRANLLFKDRPEHCGVPEKTRVTL